MRTATVWLQSCFEIFNQSGKATKLLAKGGDTSGTMALPGCEAVHSRDLGMVHLRPGVLRNCPGCTVHGGRLALIQLYV